MADPAGRAHWTYRAIFIGVALALFFFRLLPLGTVPGTWGWLDFTLRTLTGSDAVSQALLQLTTGSPIGSWPGPDLLLCVILAWGLRRPDFLPAGLIAAVVLAEDMLLMRPPGLWTGLVVIATEFLRNRAVLTREFAFAMEWLMVSGVMVALLLAYRLIFAITFLPQPEFGFAAVQTLASILCYPLVVGLSRILFDVYKPATGETDALGRRM